MMNKKEIQEALTAALEGMDLPAMRRDVTSEGNLRWLTRNILVRNSNHPQVSEACSLLKTLLRSINS